MKSIFKSEIPVLLFVVLLVISIYAVTDLVMRAVALQRQMSIGGISDARAAGAAFRFVLVDMGLFYSSVLVFRKKRKALNWLVGFIVLNAIFEASEFGFGFAGYSLASPRFGIGFAGGLVVFGLVNGAVILLVTRKHVRRYLGSRPGSRRGAAPQ